MREESPHGERRVVGQPRLQHAVAEERAPGVAAGRRHVRQQQGRVGMRAAQPHDERRRGAGFAERNGVHPEDPRRRRGPVSTVALADVLAIAGLAAAAPQEAQRRERQRRAPQQRIEAAHRIHQQRGALRISSARGAHDGIRGRRSADAAEIARPWTGGADAAAQRVGRDEQRNGGRAERRSEVHEPRVDANDELRSRDERRERWQRLPRRRWNVRVGDAGGVALASRMLGVAAPRQDHREARGRRTSRPVGANAHRATACPRATSRERTRRKDDPAAFPRAAGGGTRPNRGGPSTAIAERGGGELAATHDEMLIAVDRMMGVVRERGNGLTDARAVGAVPHAARHARDQRALDLFLQIEHGRIFLAPQRSPERREFAPRRNGEGTLPPAAQRDRNDAPDARMELQQRNESGLGDPVDRELGAVCPHVGDDGQRMDDVAERRRAYDEDCAQWCAPRAHAAVAMCRPRERRVPANPRRMRACSASAAMIPWNAAPRRRPRRRAMNGAPVLVTGCAGFIGMHATLALLAQGRRVTGVDNLDPYYDVALKEARLARLVAHGDSGSREWISPTADATAAPVSRRRLRRRSSTSRRSRACAIRSSIPARTSPTT